MNDIFKAYGIFMQSYFGGRAECRIRNWEVPVCPVDFMSQYPTVNELLGNWDVITAKRVTFPDATKQVRELLSTISLKRCFDRKFWPQFKFFALVYPDNDIFPVRTVYNGATQNIGINYFIEQRTILVCRAGHHSVHFANGKGSTNPESDCSSATWKARRSAISLVARHGRNRRQQTQLL